MYVPLENLAPTEKFNFCTWRNQHSWPTPSCLLLPEIRISKQDQVTWLTKICVHLGSLSNGTFNKVIPWNQHLEWFISFFFLYMPWQCRKVTFVISPEGHSFITWGKGFGDQKALEKTTRTRGVYGNLLPESQQQSYTLKKKSSESYLWIWRSLPQNI